MTRLLALTLTLTFAACSVPPNGGTAEEDWRILLPPPPLPLVGWQFQDCVTADQRQGLILALQTLYAESRYRLHALAGTVGDSRCIGGQEKGGLFAASTTASDRGRSLTGMAIRDADRSYAFEITRPAFDTVAAYYWATTPLKQPFDDSGNFVDGGRYQIVGFDEPMRNTYDNVLFHVIDHQTQLTIDIVDRTSIEPKPNAPGEIWATWNQSWNLAPSSSPDPFVQTIINATTKMLENGYHDYLWPALETFYSLDFHACPSLAGWALPIYEYGFDENGNFIAQSARLIL